MGLSRVNIQGEKVKYVNSYQFSGQTGVVPTKIAVRLLLSSGVKAMPARAIKLTTPTQDRESCHLRHVNVALLMVHGCVSVRRERKYSRSSIMPVRMRVLTVPRGCPSLAAISVWLKPE
jgi:hypothetical protein